MGTRTLLMRLLGKVKPSSETEWRETDLAVRKLRGQPGDQAWAKANEQTVKDIRAGKVPGDSTRLRLPLCVDCMANGVKVFLLEREEGAWCGRCGWQRPSVPRIDGTK
jgi:hypothetical protein